MPDGLRRAGGELVGLSFIVLFQELALIRWLPGQVRVLAYFPNIVLISAFLGLGIGCLRAGKGRLLWLWPVSMLALVLATIAMSRIAFTQESVSEHLWLLYYDIPNAPVVNGVRMPILIAFVLSVITFVPLGQLVAERLAKFRDGGAQLWGYSFDLLGSLIGVAAFTVASFLGTPPVVWFAAFAIPGVWILRAERLPRAILHVAVLVLIGVLVLMTTRAEYFSPYYALSAIRSKTVGGVYILANGSLHQYAAPIARGDPGDSSYDKNIREGYHSVYRLLKSPPRRVLVLGAGTGNDVAVALDEGAEQIDAVEIDPVILNLGRRLHPDKPYDSPKVRLINTDAREFLNSAAGEKYDLIVFGTLDSMTRLSALSNVRLDNFVYTLDCMRKAREHLTDQGGLVLFFMVGADYIHQRLIGMLTEAFDGEPPLAQVHHYELFNSIYAAGPAFAHLRAQQPLEYAQVAQLLAVNSTISTDDWPYLYLRGRGVSWFYTSLVLSIAVLALVAIAIAVPEMWRGVRGAGVAGSRFGVDVEMFLFGVAFLLLETKSVTQMNLVWGATWLTSAVVFGSILLMILLATILMQRFELPYAMSMGGLAVALLANYLVPTHWLLHRSWAISLAMSALFVGGPIFFAATSFGLRFKHRAAPDAAFGWNLLGAVAGGLLEVTSMAIGFRNLSLVALAVYGLSVVASRFEASRRITAPQALVAPATAGG